MLKNPRKIIKKTLILLGLCMMMGMATHANGGEPYESLSHRDMPYRLMKPISYDAEKSYPVIVSLHGAGGKGKDNRKQLKVWNKQLAEHKTRAKYPCYVVAPQATELWNKEHFLKIKEIIKQLPSVDTKRIYIMGHSMGGHGTYIMIQLEPTYFAAAAPSAGSGLRRTEDFINPALIKDIPIWAFHGDKDGVCPIAKDQKVFDAMKKLNGNMKFTIWKGDRHNIPAKMIAGGDNGTVLLSGKRCDPETDFLKWMFKQKNKKADK